MRVKVVFLAILLELSLLILPATISAQSATSASDLKKRTTDLKTDKKNAISKIREKTKEEIQVLRTQFIERVQAIKDTRKKEIIQKLDEKIIKANSKHTNRFNEILVRLQRIVDNISLDAKDPKTLIDIKSAQSKIDLAKVAVTNQAAKDYTIEITDETTLRKNVGAVISQFRNELMQTHRIVVDARQAVQILRADNIMLRKETNSSAQL